tara:strand:+ start:76 stop:1179 length:1104 start_codon:yes stop_codon:yes gene_type:complete
MSDINPIHISNGIASAAEQATITIEDLVSRMSQSGMSQKAIFDQLISDLDNNGPLFGAFKNKVKSTVRDGIEINFNQSANQIFENAGVQEYRWVAGSNSKPCPDCALRHGEVGTMQYFEAIGKPCSGFSVCGSACKCKLIPVNYTKEDVTKPITRDKVIDKQQRYDDYDLGTNAATKTILSDSAKSAIQRYTDVTVYDKLNKSLRVGAYNESIFFEKEYDMITGVGEQISKSELTTTVKKYTTDLTKSLEKLPSFSGEVYRGLNLDAEQLEEFRESFSKDRWTNKGFLSTSASEAISEGYAEGQGVEAFMSIKSKNGRILGTYSDFLEEKEVLFTPGRKFKVVDYTEEVVERFGEVDGFVSVELEEI